MNKNIISTRCATTAIAAALALGSTGLLAQAAIPDPGPVVVQSPPPAPVQVIPATPAPQPSIVPPGDDLLSGVAPQTNTPSQIPVPTNVAPVQAPEPAANATRRATAAAAPTPRTATAAPAAEPATPTEEVTTTAEPFAPEVETVFVPPVELDADTAPTAEATSTGPDLLDLAGYAVALLAFLGLIAFIIRRPRQAKRHAIQPAQTLAPERRVPEPVAPALATLPLAAPTLAPAAVTPHYVPTVAPMATYRREPVPTGRGGAVPLPRRIPEDFDERDALLKRMIAAAPDRANPFRSRKARAHRAKLIIQSIGHHFNDRDPWIDLTAYPDVWPEVANRRFTHAA